MHPFPVLFRNLAPELHEHLHEIAKRSPLRRRHKLPNPLGNPFRMQVVLRTEHVLRAVVHVFVGDAEAVEVDRKSTGLNSSHGYISYAVFCLKKKKKKEKII